MTDSQQPKKTPEAHKKHKKTFWHHVREWIEIIIMAFVVAMFIRTFVIELFRIPSGSMIPTLIGAHIAEVDIDDDGDIDLVVRTGSSYEVFVKENEHFQNVYHTASLPLRKEVEVRNKLHEQKDMILVNKSAYWFNKPDRGEIIIFRVPPPEFEPDKPIYIKRVVGLPGEKVAIENNNLVVDGEVITEPEVFKYCKYTHNFGFYQTTVPDKEVYVFGDNSMISADSRKWGGVPLQNIKGKAFFRYYPIHKLKFLE